MSVFVPVSTLLFACMYVGFCEHLCSGSDMSKLNDPSCIDDSPETEVNFLQVTRELELVNRTGSGLPLRSLTDSLQQWLDDYVQNHSDTVTGASLASYGLVNLTLVSGRIFNDTHARDVTVVDRMALGSVSKMYTGVGVMRLAADGKIGLDDPAHIHIDSLLFRENGTTLAAMFGEKINQITVRDLLQHRGPFHATTSAGEKEICTTSEASTFTPYSVLRSWHGEMNYTEGMHYAPQHTLMLALLLVNANNLSSWQNLTFHDIIVPSRLSTAMPETEYALRGWLSEYTDVKILPNCSVMCHGHYGASNLIAPPSEMARFAHEVFGSWQGLWSNRSAAQWARSEMTDFARGKYGFGSLGYGLATHSYDFDFGTSYGHGGLVCGFTNHVLYIPCLNTSFAFSVWPQGEFANIFHGIVSQLMDRDPDLMHRCYR